MTNVASPEPVWQGGKTPLTHSELKRLLHYDPKTGIWTRRTRSPGNYEIGDRADRLRPRQGYLFVKISKIVYPAHRLAIFYMTGKWPPAVTDHRNRIKTDNRWKNIRAATYSENRANTIKYHKSLSGYRGVYWDGRWKAWIAKIVWQGKQYYLGSRKSAFDAHVLYIEGAKKYFGEFANVE